MKLKDLEELCGISVAELKKNSQRYRIWTAVLYALDIALILVLTVLMYKNGAQAQYYGVALVFVCAVVNVASYFKLKPGRHELYTLWHKNRSQLVLGKCYDLRWQDLYDIVVHFKPGVGADTPMSDLKAMLPELALTSSKNNRKMMRQLLKFEAEVGNLKCFVLEHGKKQYFLGLVAENENKEEES